MCVATNDAGVVERTVTLTLQRKSTVQNKNVNFRVKLSFKVSHLQSKSQRIIKQAIKHLKPVLAYVKVIAHRVGNLAR